MSIRKLFIVAGALALAGCYPITSAETCVFPGHGDELDESQCILSDERPVAPAGAVVTPEESEETP